MVGIYFSGTGNTKYCLKQFLQQINSSASYIFIEDSKSIVEIQKNDLIIGVYPVYI